MKMENHNKEIMELGHDPIPGYRPVFYAIFAVSVLYLTWIFFSAL